MSKKRILLLTCILYVTWPPFTLSAQSEGYQEGTGLMTESDVVEKIDDDGGEQVGVHFKRHAAVYPLSRKNKHFSAWYARLKHSRDFNTLVYFQYSFDIKNGLTITSVDFK